MGLRRRSAVLAELIALLLTHRRTACKKGGQPNRKIKQNMHAEAYLVLAMGPDGLMDRLLEVFLLFAGDGGENEKVFFSHARNAIKQWGLCGWQGV